MSTRQKGLTLVELMVTLAVAIVLIAVGMPLFTSVAANNRASANTNMLVTAFNLARSEAVGRATTVSVCSSASSPPGATPACGSAAQWGNGWFVFEDRGTLGSVDSGDVRLRIWEMPTGSPPSITVTGGAAATFNYLGAADAVHTYQLSQTGSAANLTRCVTVTATGQIRSKRGTCP